MSHLTVLASTAVIGSVSKVTQRASFVFGFEHMHNISSCYSMVTEHKTMVVHFVTNMYPSSSLAGQKKAHILFNILDTTVAKQNTPVGPWNHG